MKNRTDKEKNKERRKPEDGEERTAEQAEKGRNMESKQGLIHVYCGDGKGKTTAAIGLSVRAAGSGKKVLFVQFMKGGETGELEILRKLSRIEVLRSEKQFPFYKQMSEAQKEELTQIHNRILETVRERIEAGACDLLIMDELTYPYEWELLDKEKVKAIFARRTDRPEIVCTGRNPAAFFTEQADYITEMKCLRHPYEKGIAARKGIEF